MPGVEMESHLSTVLLLYDLAGRSGIRTWPGAGLHEALFLSAFFTKRLTDAANC